MDMFPIFIIGVIVGIALSYTFYKYKEDVPSEIKIRTQENIIKRQNNDNKLLEDLNERLYNKIDRLEAELAEVKKK